MCVVVARQDEVTFGEDAVEEVKRGDGDAPADGTLSSLDVRTVSPAPSVLSPTSADGDKEKDKDKEKEADKEKEKERSKLKRKARSVTAALRGTPSIECCAIAGHAASYHDRSFVCTSSRTDLF